MSAADRDAMRNGGCAASGSFTTLLSGRIPGVGSTIARGGFDETWIRLSVSGEVPAGGSLSALYRSGPSPDGLGAQNADPEAIAQDQDYAEIRGTLTSNGVEPVRVPPAGPALVIKAFAPMLLRADRSSLPGGSVVENLDRAYSRPDYRADPVAGRARPVAVTERVGRLDGFSVTFFTPEAVREFKEEMLDSEWTIEHPAANAIHRVRLYEAAEGTAFESELLEERIGYVHFTFDVPRAEVLESGTLA